MANIPLLGSFSDVGGSSLMFRNAIINTPIYPQVITTGAAGNAVIGGFAIRVA